MSRRRDKDCLDHESLREKLIAVAEALVTQGGGRTLTARALSLHMGYSVGHIYTLVPDLPALIRLVNGRTFDRLHMSLKRAMGPRKGATSASINASDRGLERLGALTRAYLAYCTAHPHLWSLVLSHEREDDQEERTKILSTLIRAEIKTLCPKRSPEDLRQDTALFCATLQGLSMLARNGSPSSPPSGHTPPDRLADHLVGIWARALGVEAKKSDAG